MFAFLRILLFCVHLLHFKTTLAEDVPTIRTPSTATVTTLPLSDSGLQTKAASNDTVEPNFVDIADGKWSPIKSEILSECTKDLGNELAGKKLAKVL